MELRGVDRAQLDRGGEAHAVLAPRLPEIGRVGATRISGQATRGANRARGPRYNRIIRVHEVEARALRHPLEQAQPPAVLDGVPAHVRDLPSRRKSPHDARDDVEAAALAELLAAREEQLVAEADAEKRARAIERPPQRRQQAERL